EAFMIIYRIENLSVSGVSGESLNVSCDLCAYLVADDFLFTEDPETKETIDLHEYTKINDRYFVGGDVIVADQRSASKTVIKTYAGIEESGVIDQVISDNIPSFNELKYTINSTKIVVDGGISSIAEKTNRELLEDEVLTLSDIKAK